MWLIMTCAIVMTIITIVKRQSLSWTEIVTWIRRWIVSTLKFVFRENISVYGHERAWILRMRSIFTHHKRRKYTGLGVGTLLIFRTTKDICVCCDSCVVVMICWCSCMGLSIHDSVWISMISDYGKCSYCTTLSTFSWTWLQYGFDNEFSSFWSSTLDGVWFPFSKLLPWSRFFNPSPRFEKIFFADGIPLTIQSISDK